MLIISVDTETYYDKDYSLRKMTPVEYILDPRFECMGWGVTINGLSTFMEPEEFVTFLGKIPKDTAFVSHNALFDMCVLAWKFNYVPKLMIDSMGMARAWIQHRTRGVSLSSCMKELGIGVKGSTVMKVQGMRKQQIKDAGLWKEYTDYCINDTEGAWGIFNKLMGEGFPAEELLVNDMVIRCAVLPKLQLNQTVLHEHLHEVMQAKDDLLRKAGLENRDMLMSNDRFAKALQDLGVEPPQKLSFRTGQMTWAFAKTDAAMQELEAHPDPDVQALVAARLGLKTTIEETRSKRFISISNLSWPVTPPGNPQVRLMPFALRYSGAHTHRLSGDWKLNTQNLKRGGKLRRSLEAPPGHKLVVADSSQVEARGVATFAGQDDLVEQFARGEDVYSSFASDVFGFLINKIANPDERFVGKQGVLGCGYGLGPDKFRVKLASDSKLQTGKQILLTPEEAQNVVGTYRRKYYRIPQCWRTLGSFIPLMAREGCNVQHGPITINHNKVRLPNGLYLYYHDLHWEQETEEWVFTYAGKPGRLYGGKFLENLIQALCRICTMDAAVRIKRRTGFDLALQAHDELGYVVPDAAVEDMRGIMLEEMCRRPWWWPKMPLAAEFGFGQNYGEAK